MKQWVNACIREFLIPLLNYIMECVLMTTEIAEHISSMRSLPKVLFVEVGVTFNPFSSAPKARLSCPARSPPSGAADMQSVPTQQHG